MIQLVKKTDLEYSVERLQDKLNELTLADDKICELLSDEEYNEDIIDCEKFAENSHLAMFTYKKNTNTNTNFSSSRSAISGRINNALPPIADGIKYASSVSSITLNLPTIKITTFCGEIEEFHIFWERFENCIDKNEHLLLIDKHGYLDREAKRLVDEINITADTYTITKDILKSKYGNKDKILQTHLDYLENLTPIKNPSPSALNELYIDCYRRLRALDALGENTQLYGSILAPKILRAFPHEICHNWFAYDELENLAEGDITI
ncbi:integrase catalytic domain-containing protein [Nephila pilipes]|uniref:Integrase catalytic domain-containing protein n=1 Tax=Nephila pilipes TaxID=299642 RepID=A0A8X6MTM8_NEPPI|nr:integrase catalytic domain-containing protein [Nephila pilipes]